MKGKCLCGSIEVTAPDREQIGVCHCSMCRRWSGGPMFAVHCGTEVGFSGPAPRTYRSSEWAERGFCPTCGTHLFYRLLQGNEYILPVGVFQDQAFQLANEVFIDEKPAYYELKNQTKKFTGKQVFEMFASR